tara:strand:+ start:526 stop:789 length:264 start_codon:yes stop_codon:yes gene_type:complete
MDYSNRTYAFANTSTIDNIDFSLIMESSINTVRKSIDESQFLIKWYSSETPSFITDNSVTLTWSGSHADCLTQLTSSFWTNTGSLEP